jgi:type II secretory pathway component PulF
MTQAARPLILSYSSPGKRQASLLYYYLVYLAIVMMPTVLVLAFFLLVVPHFKEVFRDFKTTLPLFTEWTLVLADFVRSGFWIAIMATALAVPLLPAALTVRQVHRPARVMYVLIALVLMLTVSLIGGIVGAATLYLPLVKLIQSVSGGGP